MRKEQKEYRTWKKSGAETNQKNHMKSQTQNLTGNLFQTSKMKGSQQRL